MLLSPSGRDACTTKSNLREQQMFLSTPRPGFGDGDLPWDDDGAALAGRRRKRRTAILRRPLLRVL